MCRWFAYISSTEPCLLEDVLITPAHSLVKQVNEHYLPGLFPQDDTSSHEADIRRNSGVNIDGTGVVWYTPAASNFEFSNPDTVGDTLPKEGLRPTMYKTIQPPLHDMNFRSICANTETKVCFGHVRASSGSSITPVNNHPFVFGRHTFMHNGTISTFTPIRRDMANLTSDAAYASIFGSTDSEALAALYMTYLTDSRPASSFEKAYPLAKMAEAMHQAVATVIELQRQIIGPARGPNSLNLCATDGTKMLAYRFRNNKATQPPSLYYSTTAGTTLNRKYPDSPDGGIHIPGAGAAAKKPAREHGKHLIIASEPTTYKESEWHLIPANHYVAVDTHTGEFGVRSVPFEEWWDCEEQDVKVLPVGPR